MDDQYLNKFIDLGVEKAMRHHKFNNYQKIDWYILLSRIHPVWSARRGRIRIRNTAHTQTMATHQQI
jgi:hypothetical protein